MSLSLCHLCPRRQPSCAGPCPCLETGIDIIEMQVWGCPLGNFGPVAEAVLAEKVLEERRVVCEGCPIGSFEGWADRNRTVAKCRECEGCKRRGNAVGLIAITIHRCPRGHHEG